jgi:hypothetical protein
LKRSAIKKNVTVHTLRHSPESYRDHPFTWKRNRFKVYTKFIGPWKSKNHSDLHPYHHQRIRPNKKSNGQFGYLKISFNFSQLVNIRHYGVNVSILAFYTP